MGVWVCGWVGGEAGGGGFKVFLEKNVTVTTITPPPLSLLNISG